MEVVFIGNKFYNDSNHVMSSIYVVKEDEYIRCDWVEIETRLEMGGNVNIRPATEEELKIFKKRLEDLKKE